MKLGDHSYFLGKEIVDVTTVGKFSSIAGGVYIHGPDNHECVINKNHVSCFDFKERWGLGEKSAPTRNTVVIGNDVWIGEDVNILCGVTIGDGAIVGAHTVVAKDVPAYSVFVGNPGEVNHYRFSPEIIEKLLKIKWWSWPNNVIRERLSEFNDINRFVELFGGDENV